MADEKTIKLISKNNSGFPEYLDFDKLRSEGIEYLGKLAGKIWTDHNVHDPGITILEILCYALLDLGYRTNLPVEDILSRNTTEKSKDDNFFTPAQILACNPLTITDYRKLLIDIRGVRNAWLIPATDIKDFCKSKPAINSLQTNFSLNIPLKDSIQCEDYLNGLYHVLIDLEKEYNEENKEENDLVIEKVKKALMSHRNLCEDFVDIKILCKLPMGVCADIELDEHTDIEKMYLAIVEALSGFFTPSPVFYTLQQLLDLNRPIEDIFSGRPFNTTESHGFVDTQEFEKIVLREEIHLSDVFNAIFEVPGVKSIKDLAIRLCDSAPGVKYPGWIFPVKKNHIPEFSAACSGFRFTRNGIEVKIDTTKFQQLIEIGFGRNGKVLYKLPSPYLDQAVPSGFYRSDLADYYSIQNEFPRVYGIAEGGLPDTASDARKAQAYQLKGYLLFFDQLLANYLTQLKNIRSLFALTPQKDKENDHTYFLNELNNVPDLQKLLRFKSNESNAGTMGTEGSILMIPVDKNIIDTLYQNGKLKTLKLESLRPYAFTTFTEQDIVINQLKNDLIYGAFTCEFVTKTDECVYYYINTSSDEISLICKKYFKDQREAKQHLASINYIGTFDENYRSYIAADGSVSFDLELNVSSYVKYLQLIIEDKELYTSRRQGFLSHLMARFAEKFTDFALLSYGILDDKKLKETEITAKENFLGNYDDISSNRGKAYDYLTNKWNNDNVSGLQKRIGSLAGFENIKRHSLCNFKVESYDIFYVIALMIAGRKFFELNEKFDSVEKGKAVAADLFKKLANKNLYKLIEYDNGYRVAFTYADNLLSVYPYTFSVSDANIVSGNLSRLFSGTALPDDVFVHLYHYNIVLKDNDENIIRNSAAKYVDPDEKIINKHLETFIARINDEKIWAKDSIQGDEKIRLHYDEDYTEKRRFINLDAFKPDINNSIIGKPDKYTYDLLDKNNRFKFHPILEFDDEAAARNHCYSVLCKMGNEKNLPIRYNEEIGLYFLYVEIEKQALAVSYKGYENWQQAADLRTTILEIVNRNYYYLATGKIPVQWKFRYFPGIDPNEYFIFESETIYSNADDASKAASLFLNEVSDMRIEELNKNLYIKPLKKKNISSVKLVNSKEHDGTKKSKEIVEKLLKTNVEVLRLRKEGTPGDFSTSVDKDEASKQGTWVYRLFDKDNFPAVFDSTFTKTEAETKKKELEIIKCCNYKYTDICLGSNIINKRKDETTKDSWFHYLIKCRNGNLIPGGEMILFESVQGYKTEEDAKKAFEENYIQILQWASDIENYKDQSTKINPEEQLIHSIDAGVRNGSVVFIPKKTMAAAGTYPDDAIRNLVAIAKRYPIRIVEKGSADFKAIFPCEDIQLSDKKDPCRKKEEIKFVYYFRLYLDSKEPSDKASWKSNRYFESSAEARHEFYVFLQLLCYRGNFYVDCDPCIEIGPSYRIYIREILIESKKRFITQEEAWGPQGVERFICTTQSTGSFHNRIIESSGYNECNTAVSCGHSFYVACDNRFVWHPCKYDTWQKRDEALKAMKAYTFPGFRKNKSTPWHTDGTNVILHNESGASFACLKLNSDKKEVATITEFINATIDIKKCKVVERDGIIFLEDEKANVLAESYSKDFKSAVWLQMIIDYNTYFPITISVDEKTKKDKYCVEIKIPGLNTCIEESDAEKSSASHSKRKNQSHHCFAAWKSCCFDSEEKATEAYLYILMLLLDPGNYHPVFDCDCHSFGIKLHAEQMQAILSGIKLPEFMLNKRKDAEIIAINPQYYQGSEKVCDAVERTKKLINSEGLHLVEHILLRPRCPEDCGCDERNRNCKDEVNCKFSWEEENERCKEEKHTCFIPGSDPYSFIATVVLPAWPQRFRKKENRLLVENMLYRETPAHIMLRILWLSPYDFCCFETKYKKWGKWLALKNNCMEEFTVCDFLSFLLHRNYECLLDCTVCTDCNGENNEQNLCIDKKSIKKEPAELFLPQINKLYCWEGDDCKKFKFKPCEIIEEQNNDTTTLPHEPIGRLVGLSEQIESKEETATTFTSADLREKQKIVNARFSKYRKNVEELKKALKGNIVMEKLLNKAAAFLKSMAPTPENCIALLNEISATQLTGTQKNVLKKEQGFQLAAACTCFYLDKICFNGKDMQKIQALKTAFATMRKAKLDTDSIYKYWNVKEINQYEPTADVTSIGKLLTVKDMT